MPAAVAGVEAGLTVVPSAAGESTDAIGRGMPDPIGRAAGLGWCACPIGATALARDEAPVRTAVAARGATVVAGFLAADVMTAGPAGMARVPITSGCPA